MSWNLCDNNRTKKFLLELRAVRAEQDFSLKHQTHMGTCPLSPLLVRRRIWIRMQARACMHARLCSRLCMCAHAALNNPSSSLRHVDRAQHAHAPAPAASTTFSGNCKVWPPLLPRVKSSCTGVLVEGENKERQTDRFYWREMLKTGFPGSATLWTALSMAAWTVGR